MVDHYKKNQNPDIILAFYCFPNTVDFHTALLGFWRLVKACCDISYHRNLCGYFWSTITTDYFPMVFPFKDRCLAMQETLKIAFLRNSQIRDKFCSGGKNIKTKGKQCLGRLKKILDWLDWLKAKPSQYLNKCLWVTIYFPKSFIWLFDWKIPTNYNHRQKVMVFNVTITIGAINSAQPPRPIIFRCFSDEK